MILLSQVVKLFVPLVHSLSVPFSERLVEIAVRTDPMSKTGKQELVACIHQITPDGYLLLYGEIFRHPRGQIYWRLVHLRHSIV
jgi:hypothetical protein